MPAKALFVTLLLLGPSRKETHGEVILYQWSQGPDFHKRLGYLPVTDLDRYVGLCVDVKSPASISSLSRNGPPIAPCITLVQTDKQRSVLQHGAHHCFKGCDVSTLHEIRNHLIKKQEIKPDAASHLDTMGFFPMVAQLLKAILKLETTQIKELLQEHCIEAEWIKSEVMTDGTANGWLLQDFLHGQSAADGSKDLSEE